MLVKIKQSKSEKILLIFLIILAFFSFSSFFLIKNKCFFVKKVNLEKLSFKYPENILIMNINCGNVVIELMPEISPNAVKKFKTLVSNKEYDDVAFYRVVKGFLVQAGDLEFGTRENLDYGKVGTGKSGLGKIKSELNEDFKYKKGSVGLARENEQDSEDSQFFITLKDIPLFEGEYTPVGRVLYGIRVIEKVKFVNKYNIVPRPDFINSFVMLIN